jgi:hypothetical protein
VYHANDGGRGTQEGELFDLEADPHETNNLWHSPSHASEKARLLFRLMDWMTHQDAGYQSGRGGEALPWEQFGK